MKNKKMELIILLRQAKDSISALNNFCDGNANELSAMPIGPLFLFMMGEDQKRWIEMRDKLNEWIIKYLHEQDT